MKPETAALLKKLLEEKKFRFIDSDLGLELEYEFTDEEKRELVEAEYGTSLTAPIDELLIVVMKKLARAASDKVRQDV